MPKSNTIGCYKLGRTLGIGSFSKVKIGVHDPTSKRVAIKILNKRKLRGMEMEHKAIREIEILAKLNHPHVIRLYEVLDTPTDIFVVMEHVPRGELFDYIVANGRLSESQARKFFQQLIAAVEYCHYKGVVHRDLKPENLLLDDDYNLRLADFGLSNVMEDGFFLSTSCGSPNYAAPEVICDQLYAGPEVDVWSCGVILYALLCGCLPFDDPKIPNLFEKIKKSEYHRPPYLSEGAADLIERLLTVDPLERISIVQIRAHVWFQKKIPNYLCMDPASSIEWTERKVNSKIVTLCGKLGYSPDEVEHGLKIGYRLRTTDRKYYKSKHYQRFREAAIVYHLYFDRHYRAKFKKDAESAFGGREHGADGSPLLGASAGAAQILAELSSLDVRAPRDQRKDHAKHFRKKLARASMTASGGGGGATPGGGGHMLDGVDELGAERYSRRISHKLDRTFDYSSEYSVNWKVGLLCHEPHQFVTLMLESLKLMLFEWHLENTYCIIARTKIDAEIAERLKAQFTKLKAREKERKHRITKLKALKMSDDSLLGSRSLLEPYVSDDSCDELRLSLRGSEEDADSDDDEEDEDGAIVSDLLSEAGMAATSSDSTVASDGDAVLSPLRPAHDDKSFLEDTGPIDIRGLKKAAVEARGRRRRRRRRKRVGGGRRMGDELSGMEAKRRRQRGTGGHRYCPSPIEVKIQLYISERGDSSGQRYIEATTEARRRKMSDPLEVKWYTLDIQRLKGESLPFLDFCTTLMGYMKYVPH